MFLPPEPMVPETLRAQIARDYERFAEDGLPQPLEDYLAEAYGLDLSTRYGGIPLPNPWGKASGQLSMTARQVEEDVEAGLAFVVLKTVIAQDEAGGQTMQDWAIREARMVTEPIVGASGKQGWTVSWKGRGWWQSFEDYLQLITEANQIASGNRVLVVPSCKYHLPGPRESDWNTREYEYTTQHLESAWRSSAPDPELPMPLEKDFSPTLAGSDRAEAQAKILEWLRAVPGLIRGSGRNVRVGLKIFNALFDDEFQLAMLRAIHEPGPGCPDFYIYANRLFDPGRVFEGHRGIAYGGPDLSDRNLRIAGRFQNEFRTNEPLPWSATGDITTGQIALEYALRGASSFQMHTVFQLPASEYRMKTGSRSEKALHELTFHPETGLVTWLITAARLLKIDGETIRLADVIGKGPDLE